MTTCNRASFARKRSLQRKRLSFEALEDRRVLSTGWVASIGGTAYQDLRNFGLGPAGEIYAVGRFDGTTDFDPGDGVAELTDVDTGDQYAQDVYVAKYTPEGTFQWVRSISTPGRLNLDGVSGAPSNVMAIDAAGNAWVAGTFGTTTSFGGISRTPLSDIDMFVARLTPTGEFDRILQFGWGSGRVGGIAATPDCGVVVVGYFEYTQDFDPDPVAAYPLTSRYGHDAFALKLDANGQFAWARRMGGEASGDHGTAVSVDANGNVFVGGILDSDDADFGDVRLDGPTAFVSKLSSAGEFLWTKAFAANNINWYDPPAATPRRIGVATDGNIYLTGRYTRAADFDPGPGVAQLPDSIDGFVMSLDANGNYRWANQLPGYPYWPIAGSDGNVYISVSKYTDGDLDPGPNAAYLNVMEGGADACVVKLASNSGALNGLWRVRGSGFTGAPALAMYPATETMPEGILLGGRFEGIAEFDTGTEFVERTSIAGSSDAYMARITEASGTILGRVLRDLGTEGQIPIVAGTVYLDADGDGRFDSGEPTALTGRNGAYEFHHLASGVYTVRLVIAAGLNQISPVANAGHNVTLEADTLATGKDFIVRGPQTTLTFSNTTALKIPDRKTVTSKITVSDARKILDMNVKLNITHTYDAHLDVYLIAPDGTRIELTTDNGSLYDNYTNTVFSDEAGTKITAGAAPFTGTFRPETPLNVLDGKSLQGTWTLEVTDQYKGYTGTLKNWSLIAVVDDATGLLAGAALVATGSQASTNNKAKDRDAVFATEPDFAPSPDVPSSLALPTTQVGQQQNQLRKPGKVALVSDLDLTSDLEAAVSSLTATLK